jgi:adenosylcobinamide kinase/adenosylcobinamide-phosphate guanylyltransferase
VKTLVIGGARSGKSRAAEALVSGDVTYVATGYPSDDADWAARIAAHQARRPASWTTVESLDLVGVLSGPGGPVLVDCLTLWLTRILDQHDGWNLGVTPGVEQEYADLVTAVRATTRDLVLVTNEVGQGVVPETPAGRLFRDEMGRLNQLVADACDDVVWCIAGRTVSL